MSNRKLFLLFREQQEFIPIVLGDTNSALIFCPIHNPLLRQNVANSSQLCSQTWKIAVVDGEKKLIEGSVT